MALRATPLVAAGVCFGLLAGCGYVGDPLPPALHIPKPVAELSAQQVGGRIVVRFVAPEFTTEDLPLKIGEVDLRAAPVEAGAWPPPSRIPVVPADETGPRTAGIPLAADWIGRRVRVSVRVASHRGKWSDWPAPVAVDVVEALPAPANAAASSAPTGVRLSWQQEGSIGEMRIYKRPYPNAEWAEVARVAPAAREWLDPDSRFDVEQQYVLERVRTVDSGEALSDRSAWIRFTAVDKFPPSVPGGLTAIPGIGAIELAWDRPAASDLAGFRVYRAEGDGSMWTPVGELVAAASLSDRGVRSGVSYRYAVTSVDRNGNESARCEPVTVVAP
jgi:hypothetical protein